MFRDANRPNTWAATTVRDAECFVQIQVAYVGVDRAGGRQRHLRVHICTIHVDLPTVCVHGVDDFDNSFFVHAVSTNE
jgi:hypothetical protein